MTSTDSGLPPFPFIVSAGRSGTTMLRAMFSAHPAMAIPPESPFFAEWASDFASSFDPTSLVRRLTAEPTFASWGLALENVQSSIEPTRDYASAVRALYGLYAGERGKSRHGDKTPRNAVRMLEIKRLWPEARFIHVVRDGRNVALSYFAISFGPDDVERAAIRWRTRVFLAAQAAHHLGSDCTTVRYEELVDDPERELRRLCGFVGLDFDDAMLRYHEHPEAVTDYMDHPEAHVNIARPPTKGIRDWRREMSAAEVETFEQFAGLELSRFGYERRTPLRPLDAMVAAALPPLRAQLAARNALYRVRRDGVSATMSYAWGRRRVSSRE